MEWARHEFRLDRRDESGISRRAHLSSLKRQTGRTPAGLANPHEFPAAIVHVWGYFAELNDARGSNGFGPAPISYTEMAAWAALTGRRVSTWEVQAIKALDRALLEESNA